jgi:hypothetical protein
MKLEAVRNFVMTDTRAACVPAFVSAVVGRSYDNTRIGDFGLIHLPCSGFTGLSGNAPPWQRLHPAFAAAHPLH